MKKVLTIGVDNVTDVSARMRAAGRGQRDATARFTFTSAQDLLRTLNANRWDLLSALAGSGPIGVRELGRRVGRDVKGVHTDAQALVDCGLIDKSDNGALSVPYSRIHLELDTAV